MEIGTGFIINDSEDIHQKIIPGLEMPITWLMFTFFFEQLMLTSVLIIMKNTLPVSVSH